jgi:c-di-GMP-binding flagellar brake protein YcgR
VVPKQLPVVDGRGATRNASVTAGRGARRFERVPFYTRVTVASNPEGTVREANSVDISLGGVGLICHEPLSVGSDVSLTFHLGSRPVPTLEEVSGRVRAVRFDEDATLLGVEFADVLSRGSAPALVRAIERL